MFSSVFLKTLFEKRWMALGWGIGVAAMSLLMMSFYHSFSDGVLDELAKNLPKSFQGLVGDLQALKTVPGFVAQQVFALRIPLLTIIMSVILFSGLLAGDEAEGSLQTILTRPIKRHSVYMQKLLAGLIVSLLVCLAVIPGVTLGLFLINESMSFWLLFQAVLSAWLVASTFGVIGFSIGAITGKRGQAGSFAGIFAFVSYLITSFVASVPAIQTIERLSLFHYYNKPAVAEYGLTRGNSLIFIVVILVCSLIGLAVFVRRDIYQR
ncbi:MAG: ABC transporter permease subunit [Patescibacteria group bacterium]